MNDVSPKIPFFGARKFAKQQLREVHSLQQKLAEARCQLIRTRALTLVELEEKTAMAREALAVQARKIESEKEEANSDLEALLENLENVRRSIIASGNFALLREAGNYHHCSPLSNAVAYRADIEKIVTRLKELLKKGRDSVLPRDVAL